MSDDDVVILHPEDDDDRTVFQTEQDKKKLEQEILGHVQDTETEDEIDTTVQMIGNRLPYWQRVFG